VRLLLTIVLCLAVTSCSRYFWVQPIGSLAEGVAFDLYEDPGRESPAELRIVHLEVLQFDPETKWSSLWTLRGSAWLRTIRYGHAPEGLDSGGAAPALSHGVVYSVIAHDRPRVAVPGAGSALFLITSTGAPLVCDNLASCQNLLIH
jgi:hypothetical protein